MEQNDLGATQGHAGKLKSFVEKLFFAALVLWLIPRATTAATWFVATNGSDSAAGTIDAPWKTISQGSAAMAPGDTLNLRGGTYCETNWTWQSGNWRSGSLPSQPTVIQAYGSEKVTIQQNDGGQWTRDATWVTNNGVPTIVTNWAFQKALEVIRLTTQSNVVFSGLIFDNQLAPTNQTVAMFTNGAYVTNTVPLGGSHVMKITGGASRIIVTNCTIMNAPSGMGMLINGDSFTGYHLITHCTFTNIAYNPVVNSNPLHDIYVQNASNIVEYCTFEQGPNVSYGVHNFNIDASGNIYRKNVFRGSGNGGVIIASGNNNEIYNNLFYNNLNCAVQINYGVKSNLVANNTIYGCYKGIWLNNCSDNVVVNNIITRTAGDWALTIEVTATNTMLLNNLVCSNTAYYQGQCMYLRGVNTTASGNMFGDTYNAGLANPPGDMMILGTSDAVSKGRPLAAFSEDISGCARAGTWSIGAVQYRLGGATGLRVLGP